MSLPVCKFYSYSKKCKFGEHCRFLHSINQKPPPLQVSQDNDGKAVSSQQDLSLSSSTHQIPVSIDQNDGLVNQFASSSLNPATASFSSKINSSAKNNEIDIKDQTLTKKGAFKEIKNCRYFAQHGSCAFGRSCRFSHILPDGSIKNDDSNHQTNRKTVNRSRDVAPRFQRKFQQTEILPESFALNSKPAKNDLDQYQDVGLSTSQSVPHRICFAFKRGQCKWGKRCRFSHNVNKSDNESLELSQDQDDYVTNSSPQNPQINNHSSKQENSAALLLDGNKQKTISRPPTLNHVLKFEELEEADENQHRLLEINYFKRRFTKHEIRENEDNFEMQATFSPSDPDWPFDISTFKLAFILPSGYPKKAMTVKVLGGDEFPETVRRCLQASITNWLEDRHTSFAEKGNVELVARPFLRWLDRKIEDLLTEALKQLKRDLIAKAAGLEFYSSEELKAKVEGGSKSNEKEEDDSSQEDTEEEDDEEDDEEEEEDSDSESESELGESDSDEDRGPSLNLDPERRGTEIALRHLQLKEKATSLLFERLKLIIQCARCKNLEEITVMPQKIVSVTCGKCNHDMLSAYRASLAHQFSAVVGYLDLEGCSAFDLILQDCRASVTCMNCSKQTRINGFVSGQLVDGWCQACNARFKIATESVKFSNLVPSGVDIAKNSNVEVIQKKPKKPPKDPQIKEGCPLPDFGTCKHYKHSYRWLRFPCCGKAYPCDICHDKKEDHEMVFANRMICGHCCKEQNFSASRPCNACGSGLTKTRSAHWEGGTGCRDKISMSRLDTQKYKNMNKTTSNHKKKVQTGGSKKKTTKLRHV